MGAATLKDRIDSRNESLRRLVQDNFAAFVSCKDTIDGIYSGDMADGMASDARLRELGAVYGDALGAAEKVWVSLLDRKEETDRTRSVLGALHRFEFLFHLPRSIKKNIQAGDMDQVVYDYRKARSLMMLKRITLFERILEDVEQTVERLRAGLFAALERPWTNVAEQERIIGYLGGLQAAEDPAWFFVRKFHAFIVNHMEPPGRRGSASAPAMARGVARLTVEVSQPGTTNLAEFAESMRRLPQTPDVGNTPALGRAPAAPLAGDARRDRARLVFDNEAVMRAAEEAALAQLARLKRVLVEEMPDFWRVARRFMEGKYRPHRGVHGRPGSDAAPVSPRHAAGLSDDELTLSGRRRRSSTSGATARTDLVEMVNTIGSVYFRRVESLLVGLEGSSRCVAMVLETFEDWAALDMPASCARVMRAKCNELVRVFIQVRCGQVGKLVRGVADGEDWAVGDMLPSGDAPSAIPEQFDAVMRDLLDDVIPIVDAVPGEGSANAATLFSSVLDAITNMLDCLHALGMAEREGGAPAADPGADGSADAPQAARRKSFADRAQISVSAATGLAAFANAPSAVLSAGAKTLPSLANQGASQRLFIVLTNVRVLSASVVPGLFARVAGAFPALADKAAADGADALEVADFLSALLVDEYVRQCCVRLTQLVTEGVHVPGALTRGDEPSAPSAYTKRLLLALVLAHVDMVTVSREMTRAVLARALRHSLLAILDGVAGVDGPLSRGGVLQVNVDVLFIMSTLRPYADADSEAAAARLRRSLWARVPGLSVAHSGHYWEAFESTHRGLVDETRKKTRALFQCFGA